MTALPQLDRQGGRRLNDTKRDTRRILCTLHTCLPSLSYRLFKSRSPWGRKYGELIRPELHASPTPELCRSVQIINGIGLDSDEVVGRRGLLPSADLSTRCLLRNPVRDRRNGRTAEALSNGDSLYWRSLVVVALHKSVALRIYQRRVFCATSHLSLWVETPGLHALRRTEEAHDACEKTDADE